MLQACTPTNWTPLSTMGLVPYLFDRAVLVLWAWAPPPDPCHLGNTPSRPPPSKGNGGLTSPIPAWRCPTPPQLCQEAG